MDYEETLNLLKQADKSIIRCTISGIKTEAYVYVDRFNPYLFQDVKDGACPERVHPNDYGYRYSWVYDDCVRNVEFIRRYNEEEMFKSLDELLK